MFQIIYNLSVVSTYLMLILQPHQKYPAVAYVTAPTPMLSVLRPTISVENRNIVTPTIVSLTPYVSIIPVESSHTAKEPTTTVTQSKHTDSPTATPQILQPSPTVTPHPIEPSPTNIPTTNPNQPHYEVNLTTIEKDFDNNCASLPNARGNVRFFLYYIDTDLSTNVSEYYSDINGSVNNLAPNSEYVFMVNVLGRGEQAQIPFITDGSGNAEFSRSKSYEPIHIADAHVNYIDQIRIHSNWTKPEPPPADMCGVPLRINIGPGRG